MILARRSYFEMGFRQSDLSEDYDLMLRAADEGIRFGKVDEVLLDWTDHPDRLTRTDSRYTLEAFMRCRQLHFTPLVIAVGAVDARKAGLGGEPGCRHDHQPDAGK